MATRRAVDQNRAHRDQYPAWLFAVAVGLFLLSQLDSLLTLIMLESGRFFEANPVMQMLLDQNPVIFVGVRSVLWGGLLIFLVAISGWTVFRRIRVIAVVNGLFVLHALHSLFSVTVLSVY